MKVGEFKVALSVLDDNLMLVVRGYEGGYTEVESIMPIHLTLNQNEEWCYGEHEEGGEVVACHIQGVRH